MDSVVLDVMRKLDETKVELIFNGMTDHSDVAHAASNVSETALPAITEILRVLIGAELLPVDAPTDLARMVEKIAGISRMFAVAGAAIAVPLDLAQRAGISVDELKASTPDLDRALFLTQQSLVALGATVIDCLRRGEAAGLWKNGVDGCAVSGFVVTPEDEA